MKEKLRLLIEKVKLLFKKVVEFLKKVVLFLKKYGKWFLHGINLIVVGMAYYAFSDSLLVGLWFFLLIGYYLFWKILRAETLFKKKDKEDEL